MAAISVEETKEHKETKMTYKPIENRSTWLPKKSTPIQGYKIVDCNYCGRDAKFTYEVGSTYVYCGEVKAKQSGLHYCLNPIACIGAAQHLAKPWRYLLVTDNGRDTSQDGHVYATNALKIDKEISQEEWDELTTGFVVRYNGPFDVGAYKEFYTKGELRRLDGGPTIESNQSQFWIDENGWYHRENGLPCFVKKTEKGWYVRGSGRCKDDLPTWECEGGKLYWTIPSDTIDEIHTCMNGVVVRRKKHLFHRDNGLPAILDGKHQEWWENGERHRGGGLPAIIYANGKQDYYFRGKQGPPPTVKVESHLEVKEDSKRGPKEDRGCCV